MYKMLCSVGIGSGWQVLALVWNWDRGATTNI